MSSRSHPLRFVFLGTGTSGGVPVIACDCAACTSDDPRDRRTRQGAALQWIDPGGHHRTVLIDATPDLREQALRHELQRCDAIVFTHHHVDHIFGLDEVRRFNAVMQAPIDIYAEQVTLGHLRRVYQHVFDVSKNENKSFVATLIAHAIEPGLAIDLWGLRFTPIRLLHGRLPILGFRIDAVDAFLAEGAAGVLPLVYATDTSAIPPETWGRLEGLATLVLDGLRPRHHPTHFTIDQAVAHGVRIGAGATYLVHIAHEIVHAEVDPTLPEGIHLGFDGLILGDAAYAEPRAGEPTSTGSFAEG